MEGRGREGGREGGMCNNMHSCHNRKVTQLAFKGESIMLLGDESKNSNSFSNRVKITKLRVRCISLSFLRVQCISCLNNFIPTLFQAHPINRQSQTLSSTKNQMVRCL